MSKRLKKEFPFRVIASAIQGCQSPASAKKYGRDSRLGAPCIPLIKNLERYSEDSNGELMLLAAQGSYVTEIEPDPFFHSRNDVYMNPKVRDRLSIQRRNEKSRRNSWESYIEEHPDSDREMPTQNFFGDIPSNEYRVFSDLSLNDKICLFTRPHPSQNRDPMASSRDLPRHLRKSVVFPATKQRLVPSPKNLGEKSPRLILSTGCCTFPNYNGSNDRGDRAFRDHTLGCAVIDIIDDKTYLARLAKANSKGTLFDLGIKYVPDRDPQKADAIALVVGDFHIPFHHQKSLEATIEMANLLGVKEVITGDVIDFVTIVHHEWDNALRSMDLDNIGLTRLQDESKIGYDVVKYVAERIAPAKLTLTHGNHDDFVFKYLASGRHFRGGESKLNGRFCQRVMEKMDYGKISTTTIQEFRSMREDIITDTTRPNVLKACLESIGPIPSNVSFLGLGSDHRLWGVQTGAHGHKGPRGTRGNLNNLIYGFGKTIIGHTHQLEEKDGSISVSTISHPLEYERGQPSMLVRGNAVIYNGGLCQGIPIIGEEALWATEDHKKMLRELK